MIATLRAQPGTYGFAVILVPAAIGGAIWSASGLPLGWLMGAALVTGAYAMTGRPVAVPKLPHRAGLVMIGLAQIIVGLALGARFERQRLASIPRAMAAGLAILALIMAAMAAFAALAGMLMPQDLPSLILAFSIGGMAEMVLTAKVLHRDIALVAAFQTLRGVTVNAVAGAVWQRLGRKFFKSDMRGD